MLFAQTTGHALSPADGAVLFLTVWIIYVGDRILDGWPPKPANSLKERHLFCRWHRTLLAAFLILATGIILWLITDRLRAVEIIAGAKLGVLLVAYMAAIHTGRGRIAKALPKEIVVGLLFAVGVSLPLWSRFPQFLWHAAVPWIFFALLCSLNCVAIECWEKPRDTIPAGNIAHPLVRWADPRLTQIAGALALAALITSLVPLHTGFFAWDLLAISLSALLLLILNIRRSMLSPAVLRVLADAALVLPAIILLVLQNSGVT